MRHPLKSLFARATTPAPKTTLSRKLTFHELEDRAVPATLYVDNAADYTITTDIGAVGLSAGDTVTWNGAVPVAGLTFGTHAFATIQSAINAAAVNDTVTVAAGNHAGGILIDRTLTIIGESSPTVTTADLNGQNVGFQYAADNGTLQGFNIVGGGAGNRYGVLLSDRNIAPGYSGATVENCSFSLVQYGVATADGSFDYSNAVIQNNSFMYGAGAIWGVNLIAGGGGHLVYGNSFSGISTQGGILVQFINNVTVGGTGVGQGNTFNGLAGAIAVADASNTAFVGNTVTGTLNDRGAVRIEGNVNGITVSQNTITGGINPAIRVRQNFSFSPNNGIVAHNNFFNSNTYGIQVDANGIGSDIDARFNNFTGNTLGTILNSDANNTVNVSSSHLGDTVLGTVSAGITGSVDYTPYLNSGTDADGVTLGFQGDFSDITVHASGTQLGAPERITEGYNALTATGTLHVLGGSYTENVDLGAGANKAVTFSVGESPAQVTINGNLTLTSNDSLPIEIDGTNPATQYDNLIVNGTVTLGSATLPALTGTHVPVANDVFTIINNDGSGDAVSGTFAGLPAGTIVTLNGQNLKIFYTGNDGNDVIAAHENLSNIYVDDSFTPTIGLFIGDADTGTTGSQPAIYGYNAFNTINAALAVLTSGGTVIVNDGAYAETVTLSGTQTLEITGPDAAQSVTINALTTAAGQFVNLEGSSTLTFGDATATTVAGPIIGSGNLVKQGAGTVTFTGTNSYSGTTNVNAGTLLVNGANNGVGAVEVNSAATLGGTGTITGPVNGNASGTVSPGSPTTAIGNLTTGNLDLDATSTLAIQISGNNNADRVTVNGTVDVTGATLTYNTLGGYVPAIGHSYTIINNNGTMDPVVGTFDGLLQGAAIYNFLGTGLTAHINYAGGDGNDVVISLNPVVVMPNGDLHVYGNNLNNVISLSIISTSPKVVSVVMDNVSYGNITFTGVVRTFGAGNTVGGADTVILNGSNGNDTFTVGADVTAPDSLQDKVFALNGITFTSHNSEAYQLKGGNGDDTFNVLGLGTQAGSVANDTNVYLEGGMGADQIISQLTLADVGGNARTDWNILGPQRGNIEGLLTFNWVEEAEGNGLDDYFTFSNGATMPSAPGLTAGVVGDGGTNTMNMALSSTSVSVTFTGPNAMNTSQGPATGVNYLVGSNAATDRITGHNDAATWNITDVNDGTYNAGTLVTFENFETLVGGTGVDTFIFDADGRITGQLDGGSQGVGFRDVIDVTARAAAVTVTISPPTIKEGLVNLVGSWSSVEEIQANPANAATNNLTASNGGNTWTLTAANAGTLNALTFSGFGTLVGGTSTDNFLVANGSASSISGGSGTDTLSYAGAAGAISVNVNSMTGGASGTTTNVTNFSGIDSLVGGNGSDTVFATTGVDNIMINGATSGTINTSLPFTGFETVDGRDSNDTFTVTSTTQTIANVLGGNGTDTLIGANRTNAWALTANDAGTLNVGNPTTLTFDSIENLTGGSGVDTFNFTGFTITGTLNGGGNNDVLQVGSRNVTLTNNVNGTATGVGGTINFISIENLQSSGGSTLTGANISNIWRLTGANAGILNSTTLFSGFTNLVGNAQQDRLQPYQGYVTSFDAAGGSDVLDYAGTSVVAVPRPYNVTPAMLLNGTVLSGVATFTIDIDNFEIVSGNIYA